MRPGWHRYLCILGGLLSLAVLRLPPLAAQEPLAPRIDQLIAAGTPDYDKRAAPRCDDAEFLRRVTLDLTGSIPTALQTREFLADADPEKRTKLVDRLLASPEFARQMARVFDVVIMRRLPNKYVAPAEFQNFLRTSFLANRPWDAIVRDILNADGHDPATRPAARFYLDREVEVNLVTRDLGRTFLGVNLECAQCHTHPHIEDYRQSDYYGLSAFVVRSYLAKTKDNKQVMAEKAEGEVVFESVFEMRDKVSKGPRSILPGIFSQPRIEEPKFDFGQEYALAPAKDVVGVPNFSRRAQLANVLTSPENPLFRRAIANRVWSIFFGRGLIEPVEYDHSENPPSHPELMDLLAADVAARGFDLRGLIREILLTQTYQRASRLAAELPEDQHPEPQTFAVTIPRPLSAEQFGLAVMQATGFTDVQRAALGEKATEEALHARTAGYEQQFVNLFAGDANKPSPSFDATIEQSLFLSNGGTLQALIAPSGNNLVARLMKLPVDQPQAVADELYVSALTRPPQAAEIEEVTAYLTGRDADRPAALQELVWAIVTSAEFRFNH